MLIPGESNTRDENERRQGRLKTCNAFKQKETKTREAKQLLYVGIILRV